jgi:hypothetical protein
MQMLYLELATSAGLLAPGTARKPVKNRLVGTTPQHQRELLSWQQYLQTRHIGA